MVASDLCVALSHTGTWVNSAVISHCLSLLHECPKIDPGAAFYEWIETVCTVETRHQLSKYKESQHCLVCVASYLLVEINSQHS